MRERQVPWPQLHHYARRLQVGMVPSTGKPFVALRASPSTLRQAQRKPGSHSLRSGTVRARSGSGDEALRGFEGFFARSQLGIHLLFVELRENSSHARAGREAEAKQVATLQQRRRPGALDRQ